MANGMLTQNEMAALAQQSQAGSLLGQSGLGLGDLLGQAKYDPYSQRDHRGRDLADAYNMNAEEYRRRMHAKEMEKRMQYEQQKVMMDRYTYEREKLVEAELRDALMSNRVGSAIKVTMPKKSDIDDFDSVREYLQHETDERLKDVL